MAGEVLGVVDAIQLGASEYVVRFTAFTATDPMEDFLRHIGVSQERAGHRSVYAVPVRDIEGPEGAPLEHIAVLRSI
jgi:hypothetical protein